VIGIGIGSEVQYQPATAHIFKDLWRLNHGIVGSRLIAVFEDVPVYDSFGA
jgi:hypothetical protein